MKRVTISFLSLLLLTQVNAQFDFGIKLGPNIAKEKFSSDAYSTSARIGFAAGATAVYTFSKLIKVQADLLYSSEGTKEKFNASGASGVIKEGFVNLPVLAQAYVIPNLFVEAGPQFSFLLSSKQKFGSATSYQDIKQYYKPVDIRLCAGAGYYLDMLLKGLGVEARYAFSLSNFDKSGVNGGHVKNQVFSVYVFYLFSEKLLKKK